MTRAVLLAAARRLLVLVCATTVFTVLVSLGIGALEGASANRSISLGLYLVGCFLTIAGFFLGNRGPVRLKGTGGVPLFGTRFVRWATPSEREETLNDSAIFVFIGIVLILFGIIADNRITLV